MLFHCFPLECEEECMVMDRVPMLDGRVVAHTQCRDDVVCCAEGHEFSVKHEMDGLLL
jgi:hypothetical protein